jgi:hypothetical protein
MSSPPDNQQPNFRQNFTDFLNDPTKKEKANKVTVGIVRTMNRQMVREKVPMSRGHYEAAVTSISKGDSTCQFLVAENSHVLDSKGNGIVYETGKGFHHAIHHANQPMSKDTEEFMRTGLNPF